MARIVILTLTYDDFANRDYQLRTRSKSWITSRHEVHVAAEIHDLPSGEIAGIENDRGLKARDSLPTKPVFENLTRERIELVDVFHGGYEFADYCPTFELLKRL